MSTRHHKAELAMSIEEIDHDQRQVQHAILAQAGCPCFAGK